MTAVRIGVIGCGRIAQTMHLPFLAELPQFELVALSDISEGVLSELRARHPGVTTHVDYAELLVRADIDAVAVLTPDHVEIVERAVRAGKHVFVEKPLCFTGEEGRRLVAATDESGVRGMIGYMRRYDPAVRRLLSELEGLGEIRIVRARDTLGFRSTPTDVYTLALAPEDAGGHGADRAALNARLGEGVGSDDPLLLDLYWIVLMLGVHDLAVLRAVIGAPLAVTGTELLGRQHLVTAFRYANGARAILELGVWPAQTWTTTELDVVTDTAIASLSFPNPWIRYLPTTLRTRVADEDGTLETRAPDSFRSGFREEWLEFYDAITSEREPLTTMRHGLEDVRLAAEIVNAIPSDQLEAFRGAP
jgi:predicted dehydrogenase